MKFADDFSVPTHNDWLALVETTLRGKTYDKAMKRVTYDGLEIDALGTPASEKIAQQPTRIRGEWAVVSPNWATDPRLVNANMLEDLERGASAVAVTIGAGGVKPQEVSSAFEGVYLNMVPFILIQGTDFLEGAESFLQHLDSVELDRADVAGTLGIDPIGTLARFGYLRTTAEEAIEQAASMATKCVQSYPGVAAFVADGTVYSNAGAPEALELAGALSSAVSYLRAMEKAGLDLKEAAKQIHFTLSASAELWLTIAKFRALRRVWQTILAACGVTGVPARINAVSAVHMTTMKDPWVNILRGTAACFAAGVAGADTITTLPHDLMLGSSDSFSRRIARNIQIILMEESSLAKVADPAAGSYALESLTADLAAKTVDLFKGFEEGAGVLGSIRSSAIQEQIADIASKRASDVRKRKNPITGISEFPNINDAPMAFDASAPAGATDAQKLEGYEYADVLPLRRPAFEFECLRFKSDAILQETGNRPMVFLANMGAPADFTARATFAKNFFEAGGIEAAMGPGAAESGSLGDQFKAAGAEFGVVCGSDLQYEQHGADVISALKTAGCKRVYMAGKASEADAYFSAGLDEMIFLGCDVVDVLERAYEALERGNGDGS